MMKFDNFEISKSTQNMTAIIYGICTILYMLTNYSQYNVKTQLDYIYIAIAVVSTVFVIAITLTRKMSNRLHGILLVINALIVQVAFLLIYKQFVLVHVSVIFVVVCVCIYEDVVINRLTLLLTVISYTFAIILYSIRESPSKQEFSTFVEIAFVVFFIEIVLSVIIGKIEKYKKIIKENIRSSEDMLKLVELKRVEAENAARAKGAFLSNMSHEIRTPINSIIGMNEIIMRESNESNIIDYADRIKSASQILISLINDILDFSKIESGKMTISEEKYILKDMISDIYNLISLRTEAKGLLLKIEVDSKLPSILYGDSLRIKQCIINVLTNAVKYTNKGKVSIKFKEKNIDEEIVTLEIEVTDTGIGIKKEDQKKIFNAFERGEETDNKHIEGTGLGMSITKNLLLIMKGDISLISEYGVGSTFTIILPQKIISPSPIGEFAPNIKTESKKSEYKESFIAPDANVLMVDDNEMNLVVFKGLLKNTKINVDTAISGKQCIEMVTNKKYDVIFMDQMMPGMDGIETLSRIRNMDDNLSKDAPVVALTANAVQGSRETYLKAGFDEYISKPIDIDKLERILVDLIPYEKIKRTNFEEKDIQSIDFGIGLKYVGRDKKQYIENLKTFVLDYNKNKPLLEKYFTDKDWENYTIIVHAIKGNARYIGAMQLGEHFLSHEQAGKLNNEEFIREDFDNLLKQWMKVADAAKIYIDNESEENGDFKEKLKEVLEAVEQYDDNRAKEILKELISNEESAAKKANLQSALDAIDQFGYGEAKSILMEYK